MNVLVTGANGFIGRALCKRMLADGYQVRGAVRAERQMTVLPSGVERVQIGNIGPKTDWSKALVCIDGIVHLAARVHVMHDSAADPLSAFRRVNAAGTKRLAQQAAEAGVKRLVYISSVKVNGEKTEVESRGQRSGIKTNSGIEGFRNLGIEGRKGRRSAVYAKLRRAREVRGQGGEPKQFFSEKDVPEPQDPYAVSKWEAEQVLNDIAGKRGLEIVILRPPLVYGPGVRANFLRLVKLVKRGIPLPFGRVKNCRSLIYIENLVDAIVTCMTNPNAAGKTYFVSDREDVSTPDLIRRIAAASGRRALMLPVPVWMMRMAGRIIGRSDELERLFGSLTVDISKIHGELGWKPPFTMMEGIRETVLWYKEKRSKKAD